MPASFTKMSTIYVQNHISLTEIILPSKCTLSISMDNQSEHDMQNAFAMSSVEHRSLVTRVLSSQFNKYHLPVAKEPNLRTSDSQCFVPNLNLNHVSQLTVIFIL
jgi:hypothetical protein